MKEFGEDVTIFEDMDVLNPNTQTYRPKELPERADELEQIHSALRPATMGSTPLNVLVYGHTGQGKSVGIELKTEQLQAYANESNMALSVVHVGCKGMDSSYHVLTHLIKSLRERQYGPGEDLPSGHQRKTLLNMCLGELEAIGGTVIIVLDEIDAIGDDDYILYELPRSNPQNVRLSIIGITNDLQFRDNLDADVRSSLGEDEISFDPYNAVQLYDILARRAVGALRDTSFRNGISNHENLESDVLSEDAIPLCSAIAAQDTGDAREAIRLLFRAARFADDSNEQKITENHVRQAQSWLEEKAIENGIKTLPTQKKLALLATTWFATQDSTPAETATIYQQYERFCETENANMLSNRRFRDRLNDLVDSNILTKTTGQGRGVENRYGLAVNLKTIHSNLPSENERLGDTGKVLKERID